HTFEHRRTNLAPAGGSDRLSIHSSQRSRRGRERPGQLFAGTGTSRPAERGGITKPVGGGSRYGAIQGGTRRFFVCLGCAAGCVRERRSSRAESNHCHHQSRWTVSRFRWGLERKRRCIHETTDTMIASQEAVAS